MRLRSLLLALLLAVDAWAQVQLPPTPAGKLFGRWLEVFNRADAGDLERFLKSSYPSSPATVADELQFRDQTGGFDLLKVEESTDSKITGLVQSRGTGNYARFALEVGDGGQIKSLSLRRIPRPADIPPPARLSEPGLVTALRVYIDSRAATDRFSGAVLITRNGKQVFAGAYGLADREKQIPNKLDTRFRIGSMNKMFTAVAIAQLAEAGKLRLDHPLAEYLPDYPNAAVARKVKIEHLLTHTGGTGDIFGPEFEKNRLKLRDLSDYVALYGKRDLKFEPGSKWEYSNYGFLLLGVLIEKISGESYYDYVRKHISKPAGMTRTDSLAENEQVEDRSVGYTRRAQQWAPNTDTLPYRGTSAGGGYSTVLDLARFAQALTGHKLLSAKYTELVTTGKVDTPMGGGKYAYGFFDNRSDGVRLFGHGGGAPGMNGEFRIFPESGYAVAVLANLDPPAASVIADFITDRLPAR